MYRIKLNIIKQNNTTIPKSATPAKEFPKSTEMFSLDDYAVLYSYIQMYYRKNQNNKKETTETKEIGISIHIKTIEEITIKIEDLIKRTKEIHNRRIKDINRINKNNNLFYHV